MSGPVSKEPLSHALAALSRFFFADATLGDTLRWVVEITQQAVTSADYVGLMLVGEDGAPRTAVTTHEAVGRIDASEYADNAGPCLDALRDRSPKRVDDTRAVADRYPHFGPTAVAEGVLSTLGLPMVVGDECLGALNLFCRTASGFDDTDVALGRDLATSAAVLVANASAYWRSYELSQQLTDAMRSRAVIEQAKGVLIARHAICADEAFEWLRRHSQSENRKLRDIARDLVERARSAAPDPASDGRVSA